MRIVSLLPSATEMVCLLGADGRLVGRSHECDFPPSIADRPVLTSQTTMFTTAAEVDRAVSKALASGESLYRLDADRLRRLRPDLIITQDLCEVCSIDLNAVRLAAESITPRPAVLSLNPNSFEDVLDDILRVGEAIGLADRARHEVVALRERFFHAADFVNPFADPPRVLFLEWTDPPFVAGHWTAQLVERAGGAHPLNPTAPLPRSGDGAGAQGAHRAAGRSFRADPARIVESAPDAVIICPCGLPLEAARAEFESLARQDWFRALPAWRAGRVALVDGNHMFNRPGPRLVDAYRWFVGWLNGRPELTPRDFPWSAAPITPAGAGSRPDPG